MTVKTTNQIVIVGWSDRVPKIISELAIANQRTRRSTVTIVSNFNKVQILAMLAAQNNSVGSTRINAVATQSSVAKTLLKAKVNRANAVIFARAEGESLELLIDTILAAISVAENQSVRMVAEVFSAAEVSAVSTASANLVKTVWAKPALENLIDKARRAAGTASVFVDLLNFDGQDIYVSGFPALAGKSYSDAVLAFNKASVIGFANAAGAVILNPKPTTLLKPDDKLIALAFDKYDFVYTGVREEISKLKFANRVLVAKNAKAALTAAKAKAELIDAGLGTAEALTDSIAALMLSQIAETAGIDMVLSALLESKEATVRIKPIEQYAALGQGVEFAQLVAVARTRSESAIGYRFGGSHKGDASTGVELNPAKTTEFTPVPGDALIVIGKVE